MNQKKSASILRKFLLFNLFVFSILGLFTFIYLQAIQPNLVKNKTLNHQTIIKNTNDHIQRLKIAFDEKPLHVALYFKDEIIYSETIKGNTILNRVYKLDKRIKGNYKVVLHNNERSYINNFKI